MPVILTQHYLPSDRIYEDVEYALYHYPRQYFTRIVPYDRFIYYRPLGESRPRPDSKTYFGHGVLGRWWPDSKRENHRFVALIQTEPFSHLVPLYDPAGRFYESEDDSSPQFRSAVRSLSEVAYWRILAAADVKHDVSYLRSTESVEKEPYVAAAAPVDEFRRIDAIPNGAGYMPHGDARVNVYESAALQERARADHQHVLQLIQRNVLRQGGATWYNNNVDLFVRVGERRMLVEAKSLSDARAVLDRARYGIGQLADYGFRYRRQIDDAQRVLAFGQPPDASTAWVAHLLESERIAFVAAEAGRIVPLNELAHDAPLLG